ncbi:hypothetical protein AZE42_08208 [Rhizopogon vesiculosus]|uniref:FAD-binding domain-containing protein n=1 Tax=Rhizopogon vesiculosus TaxID=180088 RepID=A0A1J8PXI3_9AGAM|nr:hypothetical protein AZE42_08208 [Rhizopogon vesiculosus]
MFNTEMAVGTTPISTQILVVGGGPAGSYAAAALAREGFQVTLLEATKFPRYHIGESLLPSVRHFLKLIGAEESVINYGFNVKRGAAVKLSQSKREGYTDFVALDSNNTSWNVVRSEFDDLLLCHASKCGATVIEGTKVTDLQFDGEGSSARPVSATWKNTGTGIEGRVSFDYLVDASGRNGIMSTKYLKNRYFNKALSNIACWGYWEGTDSYMPGTSRENSPWFEALDDESGWAWFIPLHDGSTSVGVVMDKYISIRKKKATAATGGSGTNLQTHYMEELTRAPGVLKLIGKGTFRNNGKSEAVKSASDFSYSAPTYGGDHFRLAGDAGGIVFLDCVVIPSIDNYQAFIDPFFSSGVHLAFTGALSAAITIAASIGGSCSEEDAQRWHTSKIDTSYTRHVNSFLLVVLGTYKQIRNQEIPVMSDVDEDNFDRAFDLIRPVIQGTADVGKKSTEDEFHKTIDFCRHIAGSTDPEMYHAVVKVRQVFFFYLSELSHVIPNLNRRDPVLTSLSGPITAESDLDRLFGDDDDEAINTPECLNLISDFGTKEHFGFKAVLERGKLGLVNV